MEYGVCGSGERAAVAAASGLTFLERSVGQFLKPLESRAAFEESLAELEQSALPSPVVNGFLPGDLKITGDSVDLPAVKDFVTTAVQRAQEAGVEMIVFGSGGARRIPDGFKRETAHEQLVAFCTMAARAAGEHGVTIVVEPLYKKECNVLTTVGESAALVREVNEPALKLLVDSFHWAQDDDSASDIVANGDILKHVHIATVPNRCAPGAEPCDFAPFFDALKQAGYDGRISIEAKMTDPSQELPKALATLKGFEQT